MPEPPFEDARGLSERVDRALSEAATFAEDEPRFTRHPVDPNMLQARLVLESLRRADRMHSGPGSTF